MNRYADQYASNEDGQDDFGALPKKIFHGVQSIGYRRKKALQAGQDSV